MKAVSAYAIFIMLAVQNINSLIYIKREYLLIEGKKKAEGDYKSYPESTCAILLNKFLQSAFFDKERNFSITWIEENIDKTKTLDYIDKIKFDEFIGLKPIDSELKTEERSYIGSIPEYDPDAENYPITCTKPSRLLRSVL